MRAEVEGLLVTNGEVWAIVQYFDAHTGECCYTELEFIGYC